MTRKVAPLPRDFEVDRVLAAERTRGKGSDGWIRAPAVYLRRNGPSMGAVTVYSRSIAAVNFANHRVAQ